MAYEEFPGLARGIEAEVDRDMTRAFSPLRHGVRSTSDALGTKIANPRTQNATARLHVGINDAEKLAQRIVNLRDALIGVGPVPAASGDERAERDGIIGGLLDRSDGVGRRIADANEALDALERELGV